jgi:hypothetical protein
METETAANPADEGPVTLADAVETAQQETGQAQTEAQTQAEGASGSLDDLAKEALGEPDASPERVIEVDGRKFKIVADDGQPLPGDFEAGYLKEADYRRKTMGLADERKALQSEREAFEQRQIENQQEARAYMRLDALAADIAELENLSIDGWPQDKVQEAARQLQQLRQQQQQLSGQLGQLQQERKTRSSDEYAKQREACIREAGAKVPNFTDERRSALENFAIEMGVGEDDAKSIVDPVGYEILHFADIGRKFIERQRHAAQVKAAGQGKPATTVGGNAPGGKAPEDMSFEEYAAWREAGNG